MLVKFYGLGLSKWLVSEPTIEGDETSYSAPALPELGIRLSN